MTRHAATTPTPTSGTPKPRPFVEVFERDLPLAGDFGRYPGLYPLTSPRTSAASSLLMAGRDR
jgi:hypothetical protein